MADHLPRFDVFEPVTEVALKPVVTNSQNTKVPLLDSTHELQIPVGLKQDLDKYVRLQDGIKILTRGGVKNLETLEKVGTETIKSDNVLDKAHSTIAAMFSSLPDSITDRQAVDLYERLETNFGTSRLAGILEIAVHQKGSVSVNKLVDVQFQRLENDNFYDRVLEELTQQFSSDIIDHFKVSRSRFMSRGD
uniref:Uncharacterized protein n=1 Tax=Peronospora matthiolae TaxID=2874970 RepID=A0AAV1UYP2_9STRA